MLLRLFIATSLTLSLLTAGSLQAAPMDAAKAAITEAEALRASEFAPAHFSSATARLAEAEKLLISREERGRVEILIDEAILAAREAAKLSEKFTRNFPALVDSRDRLKLAGDNYVRDDLGERSEREFSRVVEAAESGNLNKAKREARIAHLTFQAAQSVAAREQFVRPVSRSIAAARKQKARNFAPEALNRATQAQASVEKLIKANPDAQSEAYTISQQGEQAAQHAIRVSRLGSRFDHNPAKVESWIDASDARMAILANALGLQLDRSQSPEMQLALLKQAIEDMQSEHLAQIEDADKQVRELGEKLARYEGELSDMAEVRRKLQLKREAEAKIKRLTKLFDPEMVEILLTPDADVILRLKKLNFLSGSAVIPPEAYVILDSTIKSIDIFPDRTVRVEGHTDFMGTNAYNQELSERRANAVRDHLLLQMENSDSRFSSIGHGEEKPIANNETAAGRTKNRRIDIVLIAPTAPVVSGEAQ